MTTPQKPVKSTDNLMLNNGTVAVPLKAGQANVVKAKAGEHYRITSRKNGKDQLLDNVIVKRAGDDLQLQYADGTQLILSNYYNEAKGDGACDLTLPGQDGKTYKVSGDYSSGTDLGDGTTLVYAHGDHDALMGMATGDNALHTTLAGISGTELSYVPSASIMERIAGINPWWAAAGAAVVGAGAGIAAGMGGGSSNAAAPSTPQHNIVTGSIVAGPVVASNDLTISLYQGDGTTLIATGVISLTGTFSIDVGGYTGAVIAKVQNNGTGADYIDETTGLATDLTANLMAVGVANTGTLTMNINVLTTVAATKAGATFSGSSTSVVTATTANQNNAAVATAFGLVDLIGSAIVTTVDTAGQANVNYTPTELSAAEKYGAVLAALSGMDSSYGGNTQTSVDQLVDGLTVTGSTGTLSSDVTNAVVVGARTAAGNANGSDADSLTAVVSSAIQQVSASINIDDIATDDVVNISEQTATITGTTVSGASVSLQIGNNESAADVSGTTWSYTLTNDDISAMGQGGVTITATATLSGGGTASATRSVVVDTIAPDVTVFQNELSNNIHPVVSGTAEAGAIITAVIAGATYSTVATGGVWSIDTATAQPTDGVLDLNVNGDNSVLATATDAAGNISELATETFTIDTTALTPGLSLASDTGSNDSDYITNNGLINVSDLESDATWEYSADGGSSWTDGNGSSFDLAGEDGSTTVQVRQTDAAGNVSSVGSLSYTLDTTAAEPGLSLASDSGSSTDNITNNGLINVSSLESGATWEYSIDAGSSWIDGSGSSFNLEGEDGDKTVEVRQTDVAGNVSSVGSLSYTLDTTAAEPGLSLASDTGSNDSDYIINNGLINVSDLELDATWEYSADGGSSWTDGSGSSFDLAGEDGSTTVQVRQTDAAGNVSSVGGLSYTLDTKALIPILSLASDSGSSTDNITNNGLINVSGLESGATWEYSADGGSSWTDGSGSSFTLAGEDGDTTVQVRQTDVAGNVSSVGSLSYTLDTTAAEPGLSLASDTGNSTDNITNNGLINVSGLESGATWQYSTDGSNWANGSGSSFNLAGEDGDKMVEVRQTDMAGNVSSVGSLSYTLDTKALLPTLSLATDSGNASDNLTNNGLINVSDLESGATWEYSADGGSSWTDGNGSSFDLAGEDGSTTVQVRQTDAAGNVSSVGSLSYTLDTTAAEPGLSLASDSGSSTDNLTNNGLINVSSLESGATW